MANLDILPATSMAVIINYIGSKEEKKLTSYKKLLNIVTPYVNKLYTFSSIVTVGNKGKLPLRTTAALA